MNYEEINGKYRCYIDGIVYNKVSEIPAYTGWSVFSFSDTYKPSLYIGTVDADVSNLPSDTEKCPFLLLAPKALTNKKIYYFDVIRGMWTILQTGE